MITYKLDINKKKTPKVTGDITAFAKGTIGYKDLLPALNSLSYALVDIFSEGLIDSCIEDGINIEIIGSGIVPSSKIKAEIRFITE